MPENNDKPNDKEQPFQFSGLSGEGASQEKSNIDFILDIPLQITVELGRKRMLISDLLKLGQGSVVELAKTAGESLDVLANDRLIARGEVVVVDEKYGIRLTEIVTAAERLERMK
jgi:flagellar motor switch protein FliN/FliY